MSATIPELRHRIWTQVTNQMTFINYARGVFGNSSLLSVETEDTTNYSIEYVKRGVDTFNLYKNEFLEQTAKLDEINAKQSECEKSATGLGV